MPNTITGSCRCSWRSERLPHLPPRCSERDICVSTVLTISTWADYLLAFVYDFGKFSRFASFESESIHTASDVADEKCWDGTPFSMDSRWCPSSFSSPNERSGSTVTVL